MIKHLPIMIITVPLMAAFILPLVSLAGQRVRNLFSLAAIALVNLMIFQLAWHMAQTDFTTIYYAVGAKDPSVVFPAGLTFPVRIILKIDGFSLFMALISGIMSISVYAFSFKYLKRDGRQNYSFVLLLLMLVGILGFVFTCDLFNFFVFLEIMSISSAALVGYHTDRKHSSYAGYKYLLISAVATSFLLIGIGLLYAQYGSFNMEYIHGAMKYTLLDKMALVFIIVPLIMQAGAMPLPMWLPDAYTEAPAPVTTMLVVASQAALYGVFRVAFNLFGNPSGLPGINYGSLGWLMIWIGVLSMFAGVTMALVQHDVKRLMGYHSVSQTGYMLLGVGVGLAVHGAGGDSAAFNKFGKTAMAGGIFHIMNYTFYKGLLFLTSGVMIYRFNTRNLNRMMGLGHSDTVTTVIFLTGALAIAGVPPLNGFASKLLIYESVYQFSPLLSVMAMFVSVLTLASFVKVFHSAFLGPRKDDMIVNKGPLPLGMTAGMALLCALIIGLGLFPGFVVNNLVMKVISGLVPL